MTVHESAYILDFTHVTQTPAGRKPRCPPMRARRCCPRRCWRWVPSCAAPAPATGSGQWARREPKALRRFLTGRRVDPPLRPYLAVLAVENEVLWIPRLCASERLRLNAVPAGSVRLQVPSGDPYR